MLALTPRRPNRSRPSSTFRTENYHHLQSLALEVHRGYFAEVHR